jgi:methionine synthase I (cobalamin-dependent)
VIESLRADACLSGPVPAATRTIPERGVARFRILDQIGQRPLVLDAAMGTRLVSAGLDLGNDDPALWCVSHPDHVSEIHQRDVAAGADAIVTNTFGANPCWLARFDQSRRMELINIQAVRLARDAAGPDRFVLGSIGPSSVAQKGAAAEQAAVLSSAGVDALFMETFLFPEIERALEEVNDATNGAVPVFVSLWRWPDPPETAVLRLSAAGASVLGLNCQPGAKSALGFAERLARTVTVPLLVKPGAGTGSEDAMSPADVKAAVPKLLANNVRLIGGCCGTTEKHVAAVAACAPFHRVSLGYAKGDESQ